MSIRPLFQRKDVRLIEYLQGQGLTNVRELLAIMMPVILSLGFCPLTLLLHGMIVDCLWPPSMYSSAPNINDAISCFLVPAGMVYAISFGFAFQQVAGKFRETEVKIYKLNRRSTHGLSELVCLTPSCPRRGTGGDRNPRRCSVKFNVALGPQRPQGLLWTGSPGRPPRLSHGS